MLSDLTIVVLYYYKPLALISHPQRMLQKNQKLQGELLKNVIKHYLLFILPIILLGCTNQEQDAISYETSSGITAIKEYLKERSTVEKEYFPITEDLEMELPISTVKAGQNFYKTAKDKDEYEYYAFYFVPLPDIHSIEQWDRNLCYDEQGNSVPKIEKIDLDPSRTQLVSSDYSSLERYKVYAHGCSIRPMYVFIYKDKTYQLGVIDSETRYFDNAAFRSAVYSLRIREKAPSEIQTRVLGFTPFYIDMPRNYQVEDNFYSSPTTDLEPHYFEFGFTYLHGISSIEEWEEHICYNSKGSGDQPSFYLEEPMVEVIEAVQLEKELVRYTVRAPGCKEIPQYVYKYKDYVFQLFLRDTGASVDKEMLEQIIKSIRLMPRNQRIFFR